MQASTVDWPRPATFASWHRRLPEGFRLSVKAPRGLTHGKKLYAPDTWIQKIAEGWHELGDRRAILLVQLPPGMVRDDARLGYFLKALPHWIRVAVEFRNPSCETETVYQLLEEHGAAYCIISGANLPCVLRATSPTVYIRLHGPDHNNFYAGSYSDTDLRWWVDRAREWEQAGRDVLIYFNNDGDGNAIRNALTLRQLLEH